MKKVKYLKGLILGAFVFLIGMLILAGNCKIETFASGTVGIKYYMFDSDDYENEISEYISYWNEDASSYKFFELSVFDSSQNPVDLSAYNDDAWTGNISGTYYKTKANAGKGKNPITVFMPSSADDSVSTGEFWTDFFGASDTMTFDEAEAAFFDYLDGYNLTSFEAGKNVVLTVFANSGNEKVGTIHLPIDITNVSAITPDPSDGYKDTYDDLANYDPTGTGDYIYGAGYEDAHMDGSISFINDQNYNYPSLGFLASGGYSGTFNVGTMVFKVSESISGSKTISINQTYDSTCQFYVQDVDNNDLSINDPGFSFNVEGNDTASAEILKIKYDGTDYTPDSSVVIDGTTYDAFTLPNLDVDSTSNAINLTSVSTKSNGTIISAKFSNISLDSDSVSLGAISSNATFTGSSGIYSVSYTPTTWNAGQSIYALIEVESADTTTTKTYAVIIEKDKYTDKELSDLTFTSDGIRPDESTPYAVLYDAGNTANATFASGTLNYYLRVANNTTQVSFTPEWNKAKNMKVEYDSTTLAYTGSVPPTVSVPFASGSTKVIKIKVTAQNDSSQEYKITLYRLDNDVSLAATNPIVVTDNAGHSNPSYYGSGAVAGMTNTGNDYSITLDYGTTAFYVMANLKDSTKQKLEYSLNNSTFNIAYHNTNIPQIAFATGTGTDTKYVYFRVTAEDGTTVSSPTYKVTVSRSGGSKDSIMPQTAPNQVYERYDGGAATAITVPTTTMTAGESETGAYSKTNIPYKTKCVELKLPCKSTQTIKYRYGIDTTTLSGPYTNSSSGSWTNAIYFDGASSTSYGNTSATYIYVEVVITAQDTSSTSTYSFTYSRLAASNDNNLSDLYIYLTQTGAADYQIATPTPDSTNTYTVSGDVDYKYNGVKVEPTFNALASATVGSNTIAAVSISTGVKSGEFGFSGTAQSTVTISITVTAEDGSSPVVYTVIVTRRAAEDDTNVDIKVYDGSTLLSLSNTATLEYTYSGTPLAFTTRSVKIEISMVSSTSKSTVKTNLYNSNGTVATSNATVSDGTQRVYYIDFDNSPNVLAHTKTFTFTLFTEKNSTVGYDLKIKVARAAADTDTALGGTPVLTGVDDSQAYGTTYNPSTRTYPYTITKSTSGENYILDLTAHSTKAKVYTSYSIPTPSSSIKIYDPTNFYSQFGTFYDQTSTNTLDHQFSAGSSSTGQNLYVTVIAESGAYTTYVIAATYKDERQEGHKITDISVTIANATSNTYTFTQVADVDDVSTYTKVLGTIKVPFSTSTMQVYVTFDSTTSNLATLQQGTQGTITLTTGTKTYKYQARAENTQLGCVYEFTIERDSPSTGNSLEKLVVSGTTLVDLSGTADFNGISTIYHAIPRTTGLSVIKFVVSDNAKYTISGSGLNSTGTQTVSGQDNTYQITGLTPGQKYTISLTIQSENDAFTGSSTVNPFTIEIYTAEQTFDVQSVELYRDSTMSNYILDKTNTAFAYTGTDNYSMNVYYKDTATAYADVRLATTSLNAAVTTDGTKNLTAGAMTTYTIVVKSEYANLNPAITNQLTTIKIKITRDEPSHVATLSNLVLTNETQASAALSFRDGAFLSTVTSYIVENIATNSSKLALVKFVPTLSDNKASYTISNADTSDVVTLDGSLSSTGTVTMNVTITVTAEDGTTVKPYNVTISTGIVVASQDNSITAIIVNTNNDSTTNIIAYSSGNPSYTPTVRPAVTSVNITVTVSDHTASVYSTTDGGSEVERKSGTNGQQTTTFNVVLTNRPGNTVVKIISKAQDTTVTPREYTITITSATPDSDRSFATFKIETFDDSAALIATNNYAGTTNPNITLNVKNNVTRADLTVVANSAYSTITPSNSGTPGSYSLQKALVVGVNTISFVITSEDTTAETYTITITRDDVNTLDALVVNEVGLTTNLITAFTTGGLSYPISVGYSVDTLEFSYTLTSSTPSNLAISYKLRGTELTGNTLGLNVGLNELEVIIAANSGDETTYKVSITRNNGNDENFIITYKHDATKDPITDYNTTTSIGTYMSSANTVIYVLDRSYINQAYDPVLTVSPTAKIYDGNPYKIVQTNRTLSLGANNFTIIVTSETNIDNEYNFTIYVADSNINIESLNLYENGTALKVKDTSNNEFDYDPDNNIYNLTYAYSQKMVDLSLVLEKGFATVEVNGTGLSKGSNPKNYNTVLNINNDKVNPTTNKITIVLTIKAELLTYYTPTSGIYSKTITFQISKEEANTDTTLKTLTVVAGTKTYNLVVDGAVQTNADVTVTGNEFTLSNVGTISSYTISAVPTKLPTLTSIEQLTYNSTTQEATQNLPFTSTVDNASQSHIFTVYDEAHDTYTQYTIIVYRKTAIDPDTNNEITLITVYDSKNKSYIDNSNFSQGKDTYTFGQDGIDAIPYGLNKTYTIVVTIPAGSLAGVYIDGVEYATRQSGSIAIQYPANGDNYTKTHTVYALSKSNEKGTEYKINVVALVASVDATLKDLVVFDDTIVGFDKTGENTLYSISYGNDYEVLKILAEPTDSSATVRITNTKTGILLEDEYFNPINDGELELKTGNNPISIVVTAEDGKTTKYYTLNVYRDYADPLLSSLEVVGEDLLDSTYNTKAKFDEEGKVTHYYVKLLYGVQTFTINAGLSSDNQTYSVVSNGLTVTNNTGTTRTFVGNTKEGVNSYTITVRSPQGKSTKYTLTVKLNDKASASTNISVINIGSGLPGLSNVTTITSTDPTTGQTITTIDPVASGIDTLPGVTIDGKTFKPLGSIVADYSNGDISQIYGPYVVANKVRSLDATIISFTPEKLADAEGTGAKVQFLSDAKLAIGSNKVAVQVTSEDGMNIRTVVLDIIRLDNDYDMAIDEIQAFKNDYATDDIKESYTVDSNVSELHFNVTNKDITDKEQPTISVVVTNKDASGNTRSIVNGKLTAGENIVEVLVTPKDGSEPFTKEIKVYRTPYTLEVSAEEIVDIHEDFATDVIETETYTVGSSVSKLNFSVINSEKTAGAEQPTYTLSNNGELKVGVNNLVLTIESPDGTVIKKNIKVIREEYVYKVTSQEIASIETDYNEGKIETATYSVASNVSKINFAVANANDTSENQQPTYSVSNGGLLKAGENKLVLTITSPDGSVTRKEITVTRAHMEYTVNKTLNTFACEEVAGKDRYYTINLIDKTANAITDYKAYITFNSEKNDLVVEDLTGEKTPQTNEVLIRVSTSDGAESEVIHFQLTSSQIGTSGAWFDILFWVLLAIAIIILIIILICVNKDKYGSISKKRKNA